MAVNVVRPKEWQDAEMLEVESDARDNYAAIVEIEDWAQDHGMTRTNEHWLQTIQHEDGRVGRISIVYRPSQKELASRESKIIQMRNTAKRLATGR